MSAKMSEDEIEKIIQSVDVGDLTGLIEDLSYDGFDPVALLGHVWGKHKAHSTDFKKHLGVMIVVGVHRGFGGSKTIENISAKTAAAGGIKIKAAANFLEVKKRAVSKMEVTIGRLMVIFPVVTHKVWVMRARNRIANDHGLPLEYMYPGSPSVMSSSTWATHAENYCQWMLDVHTNLWKQTTDIDTIKKFANLSYDNPCCPDSRRIV